MGKNKKYVGMSWSEYEWNNPPEGWNPEYREGFSEAVSKRYAEYCETHPEATREDRKAEYVHICAVVRTLCPSRQEIADGKEEEDVS